MGRAKYIELLRDPRWQRKRLEIMQRDGWACTNCGDKTVNLQVHHRRYRYGMKPWQYGDSDLRTLCESCHFREGFKLIRIDANDAWFIVKPGMLAVESDENNGCRVWSESRAGHPNASVAVLCMSTNPSEDRRAFVREAIEALIMNFGKAAS